MGINHLSSLQITLKDHNELSEEEHVARRRLKLHRIFSYQSHSALVRGVYHTLAAYLQGDDYECAPLGKYFHA